MGLRQEIAEQPAIAERLLGEARPEVEGIARAARGRIEYVMVAARGTSDHAATYGQYALGAVAGLPVALATPSLFSLYRRPPRVGRALVIGVSQSGRSPDVVSVIDEARRQGALTAAITNDAQSPLAAAAAHLVSLRAGREEAVAASKTYGAELLVMAMLAAALAEDPAAAAEPLAHVPEVLRRALAADEAAGRAAAGLATLEECVVLGRGFNLATALEWALKLKELAYVRAQAYSAADFQHGPLASLPPGGQVLAVSAAGPLAPDLDRLLDRLSGELGARILLVADEPLAARGVTNIPFPRGLPEWLSPLAAIVPAQLLCYHLAAAKGIDSERPRRLEKVTLTS